VVKPVIFQIVGYQNSGKTTVANKLIERFSAIGWKVATIKHHGHGGKPDIIEEKDSSCHVGAGAVVSLVEGDGRLLIHAEKELWSVAERIKLVTQFEPDLILIEGHKHEGFPKLVLLRGEKDGELLSKLNNIRAAFYWNENHKGFQIVDDVFPYFPIKQREGYEAVCQFIIALSREDATY
jgi:molybdopterin-guanine dinucleotide biosynthesis adapter protein